MLVLSRNAGQSIMIGDDVKIIVVGVRGGQVRLGFEAADNIIIDRSEIHESKKSEAKKDD